MTPPRRVAEPFHRWLVWRLPAWMRRRILRFEAYTDDAIAAFAADLPPHSRVLDAGAGEGQYRPPFAHCRYVGVDSRIGDASWDYSRLDAVADLAHLPFRDACFHAALNLNVIEHTAEPAQVLRELCRVLAPGGALVLVVPFEWAEHQIPHDFYRYTRHGLQRLLQQAGFADICVVPVGGFFTLLGRRLLDTPTFFTRGWRWLALPLVALLAVPLGMLLPALDRLDAEQLATLGYCCRAVRPGTIST